MPEPLTPELLDELEGRWRQQGAPIASQLQPGLSLTEMQELAASVGLTLPHEARVWFGWRNGSRSADLGVPVAFSHDSLQHAVEWVEFHRRLAGEIVPDDPESIWRWSWLPWSYDVSGAALVIDAAHDTPVSPVFVHLKTDPGNVPVTAPSMGTLVRWWLELFDVGAAVYDRHAGRWRHDLARVPDHYDRRLT